MYAVAPRHAAAVARGSCVRTWSIKSVPVARDERMVVSEMGEQLSPYTEPPVTAAKQSSVKNGSGLTE